MCVLESFILPLLPLKFILEQEWRILVVWLVGKQDLADDDNDDEVVVVVVDDMDGGSGGGGGNGKICFWL